MDLYHARNHMETYYGQIKSPNDAIILFEACRLGTLPRVQRRLSEKERQQIRSGSVFVWDEREAGMRRWTDGKSWSASRVSGSFLTYREMEGKRGGGNYGSPSMGGQSTPMDVEEQDPSGGPDGYRYKPDGLVKQSFSITTSAGQHLHLISYFARSHPASANLPSPGTDRALGHVRPAKGMYPDSTVHDASNMPAVTRSPMADSPFGSSNPYNAAANGYLRHAPPQFGWPPTPGTPGGAVNGSWSGGYFPYGFPMAPMPNGMQGMPFPWAHPAWMAQMQFMQQAAQQQQQQQQQSQQQGQGQGQTPGMTAFDRAPPPLRGSGAPPPPPAPAQPYPQHQQSAQQAGPNHTPFISPLKDSQPIPAYQNSNTYQQYQEWAQRQQQAQQQQQQQQSEPQSQPQPNGTTPTHHQYQQHQSQQPHGHSQNHEQTPQQSHLTPSRPPLYQASSSTSVHSTHDPKQAHSPVAPSHNRQSIPGINALIDPNHAKSPQSIQPKPMSQQYGPYHASTAQAPSNNHSTPQAPLPSQAAHHPTYNTPTQSRSQEHSTYVPPQTQPYAQSLRETANASAGPGGAPGSMSGPSPSAAAAASTNGSTATPAGPVQTGSGYGADMHALRRLDRAFAP